MKRVGEKSKGGVLVESSVLFAAPPLTVARSVNSTKPYPSLKPVCLLRMIFTLATAPVAVVPKEKQDNERGREIHARQPKR
jgi:hypothetical protein